MTRARYLSPSQISSYRRCSLQWWFSYVAMLKMKPTGKMLRGKATHFGIETGYQEKARSGRLPPRSVVQDAAADAFEQERALTLFEDSEKPDTLKDDAVRLTGMHHDRVAPIVEPMLVEVKMTAEIDGIALNMVADVVTQDTTIIDNKVVGRKLDESALLVDAQLASYAVGAEQMLGVPVRAVRLDRLIATKTPDIQILEVGRAHVDTGRLAHVARSVADGIERGLFVPCDDMITCSWCGYRPICHGAKWWDYLRDPAIAKKAAGHAIAEALLPEEAQSIPRAEGPA